MECIDTTTYCVKLTIINDQLHNSSENVLYITEDVQNVVVNALININCIIRIYHKEGVLVIPIEVTQKCMFNFSKGE